MWAIETDSIDKINHHLHETWEWSFCYTETWCTTHETNNLVFFIVCLLDALCKAAANNDFSLLLNPIISCLHCKKCPSLAYWVALYS